MSLRHQLTDPSWWYIPEAVAEDVRDLIRVKVWGIVDNRIRSLVKVAVWNELHRQYDSDLREDP